MRSVYSDNIVFPLYTWCTIETGAPPPLGPPCARLPGRSGEHPFSRRKPHLC